MLKKICFILKKKNAMEEIEGLLQELSDNLVESCFMESAEGGLHNRFKEHKEDEEISSCMYEKKEDVLYITDDAVWQRKLQEDGYPVVAYLHAENREENFSFSGYAIENPAEIEYQSLELVWRRLTGRPWMITETKRCVIRETVTEDVGEFYEIYQDASITEYMEDLYADRDEEIAYIKDYIKNVYGFYGYGMWTVLEKKSGRIIGRAGLSLREGYEIPELGFVIGVPWQRQGFAYEVCMAVLQYGKAELNFTSFQAFVMEGNTKSRMLCEKLGFAYREKVEMGGRLYDRMVWEESVTA